MLVRDLARSLQAVSQQLVDALVRWVDNGVSTFFRYAPGIGADAFLDPGAKIPLTQV